MREPGGLTAMLGYYRANRGRFLRVATRRGVPVVPSLPVLYLHGADDGCLGAASAPAAAPVLAGANPTSTVEVVPGTGHFLHLEDPDGVGARIAAWVGT
ncbi:MAG TPA: alpha/beta hydrolase [Halomonas sp.]|nr:alpha/beta hydrolase [Halomonas sp.]